MFNNKSILITGGTGSFGKACVSILLKKYPKIKKIIGELHKASRTHKGQAERLEGILKVMQNVDKKKKDTSKDTKETSKDTKEEKKVQKA